MKLKHLNTLALFLDVAGLRISKITVRDGYFGKVELDIEVEKK